MTIMQNKAIKKIEEGCSIYKGDRRGQVVARPVANKLVEFCGKSEDFAQAVCEDDRNFTDCIAAVIQGVGNSLEDIEAYQRAVSYFFPDAFIRVDMRIIIPGVPDVEKPVETVENQPAADQGDKGEIISIFDIL